MTKIKSLKEISTKAPRGVSKDKMKEENIQLAEKITEFQMKMYAEGKHSMLIILQGMDASGKDGVIKHIFTWVNPMGCQVQSFKVPTDEELNHDFLWRVHRHAPARGMIQIFNRSHYEDVIIPKLEHLLKDKEIDHRYDHINDFEQLLEDNGTKILKFYLHVSSEEQISRLHERMIDPKKHWKHNESDWQKARKYDEMIEIYDEIFQKCDQVPWHIIPADDNWYKVNTIAKKILEAFDDMNLKWPKLQVGEE